MPHLLKHPSNQLLHVTGIARKKGHPISINSARGAGHNEKIEIYSSKKISCNSSVQLLKSLFKTINKCDAVIW